MNDKIQARLVDSGPARAALGLAHRVHEPEVEGPHPTVVMLHGLSGDDRSMWVFAPRLPEGWLLVAPRAPRAASVGGYAWLPRQADEWPDIDRFDPSVDLIADLLNALPATYGADPQQLWLMGFSQGAALAFATALREPERIRGVAGLVGFLPEGFEARAEGRPLEGMPAFMAAGRRDPMVPIQRAVAAAKALREAGAALDFRDYEAGHKLSLQGLRDLGAWWQARREEA